MFCENCGKPNPDGASFCEGCGAPLAAPQAAPAPAPAPAGNFCESCGHPNAPDTRFCENCGAPMSTPVDAPVPPVAPAAPKENIFTKLHKKNKFILPGIGAGILVLIVAIVLIIVLGNQIHMDDYMKLEVQGVDGYGMLDYDLDEASLALRLVGNKKAEGYLENSEEIWGEAAAAQLLQKPQVIALVNSINVEMEFPEGVENGRLKNGDVVNITITCNQEIAKMCDVTLKDVTMQYKVEGLGEAEVYDVLSAFTVEFEGYNGYGAYSIRCKEASSIKKGELTFTVDPDSNYIEVQSDDGDMWDSLYLSLPWTENLSNGEKIELDLGVEPTRYASYGVLLEGVQQEIEVTGLKEIESFDLFEYYTFKLTGISGQGRVEAVPNQETVTVGDLEFDLADQYVYNNGDYVTSYYFHFSESYNLSNGDTLSVEASINNDYLGRYGVQVTATTYETVIEGLGEYASDVSSVKNASNLNEYTQAAIEEITGQLTKYWGNLVHDTYFGSYSDTAVADMTLYKVVFASRDVESYYSVKNRVFLVFTVNLSDNTMSATQHYVVARCDNAVVYPDGTVSMDEPYGYYDAYTTYEDLYNYIEDSGYDYQEG